MLQTIYNGRDITNQIDVLSCLHREGSGQRCDSLTMQLEHIEKWFAWKPETDDTIEIRMDGYSTGMMYLNTVLPSEGKYRIIATGIPAAKRTRRYASYKNMNLHSVLAACAAEYGMSSACYGVDGSIQYDFLLRRHEGAGAFLSRLLQYEGAVLKIYNGRLAAISIDYAQGLAASQTIHLNAGQKNMDYVRRDDLKISSITLKNTCAFGVAQDTTCQGRASEVFSDDYPATNNAQAARWARGLLLSRNRQADALSFAMEFNPNWTSMAKITVVSDTDVAGNWLVDEVEHDFVRQTSRCKMLRCVQSIV